jgi:hypothetical protein
MDTSFRFQVSAWGLCSLWAVSFWFLSVPAGKFRDSASNYTRAALFQILSSTIYSLISRGCIVEAADSADKSVDIVLFFIYTKFKENLS